jgi:hypothetical protein
MIRPFAADTSASFADPLKDFSQLGSAHFLGAIMGEKLGSRKCERVFLKAFSRLAWWAL